MVVFFNVVMKANYFILLLNKKDILLSIPISLELGRTGLTEWIMQRVVNISVLTIIFCLIINNAVGESTPATESDKESTPMENIEIIIVFDNYPYKKGLTTEWGFSCLVKTANVNILFDTGANGYILLDNMQKLNINPKEIDKVVLSHRHWDHTGGLSKLLDVNHNVEVYCLKSFPKDIKSTVTKSGAKLIEVNSSQEICPDSIGGIFTTGSMGTFIKEQALVVKTDEGFLLITGCAHPGILNMVKKAREITKAKPLLVMGGFHLCVCDNREIALIADELQKMEVELVAPSHCSGIECLTLFKKIWADKFIELGVGRRITFPFSQVSN